jgi:hypothetical protein
LVMNLEETEEGNDCAGEGQQQFKRSTSQLRTRYEMVASGQQRKHGSRGHCLHPLPVNAKSKHRRLSANYSEL